ncbi:conserved membrane hypothetical protein [Burkholderiales bacterium]|nr:conserved membrane hypothetical protein [Burkholderiales bacterium]
MNTTRKANPMLGWMIFILIAVLGLFYVKWFPYYQRAFVAASHHSIGPSILMGTAASPPPPSLDAALDYAWAYGKAIWKAMVLGLLLGSAVQVLLPPQWIAKALGNTGFGSVAAGGLLAMPGMMCTCCAAPVVVGLRARQSSSGAAIAFWLGNSVLNPATLVFIGFVLGWNWTALRLALGILMVFGLGFLVNRLITPQEAGAANAQLSRLIEDPEGGSTLARWFKILLQMAVRLIPEYVVLVLLLGAARAWLFPQIGPDIGNNLAWIVAFAVAGTVFVIPTAGEVPIVQAMLTLGVGVGPAAALLMTLPPISVPSVAMLTRSFKPSVLGVVVVSVIAFGVAGGLLAIELGF